MVLGAAVIGACAGLGKNVRAIDGVWSLPGGGTWSTTAPQNWIGGVPTVAGDTASFLNAISADATITLANSYVVSRLVFDDNDSYTLGGVPVTMSAAGTADARIEVGNTYGNGAHRLWGVYASSSLTLANNSSSTLTISASINSSNRVTIDGSGRVRWEASSTALTGAVNVQRGTLELRYPYQTSKATGGYGEWTVNDGGTILLSSIASTNATTIPNHVTLSGAGQAGGGAIRFQDRAILMSGSMTLMGGATLFNAGSSNAPLIVTLGATNGTGVLRGTGTLTITATEAAPALDVYGGTNLSAFYLNSIATHSGGTVVDRGLLMVRSTGSLSNTGTVRVNADGAIFLAGNTPTGAPAVSANSVILNGGQLSLAGNWNPATILHADSTGGTLVIANSTFSAGGANLLDLNTLPGGAAMGIASSGSCTLGANVQLRANSNTAVFNFGAPGAGTLRLDNSLADAGRPTQLRQSGGTLDLHGNNTYSGQTIVTAGRVWAWTNTALGVGTNTDADGTWIGPGATVSLASEANLANEKFTLAGGTLSGSFGTVGGSVHIAAPSRLGGSRIKGVVSGTADVVFGPSVRTEIPVLVLENDNTFTSDITIDGSLVSVARAGGLGPGIKSLVIHRGSLSMATPTTFSRITLNSGTIGAGPIDSQTGTIEMRGGTLDTSFVRLLEVRKTTMSATKFDTRYTGPAPHITVQSGRMMFVDSSRLDATPTVSISVASATAQLLLDDNDFYADVDLHGGAGWTNDGALRATAHQSNYSLYGTLNLLEGISTVGGSKIAFKGPVTGAGGLHVSAANATLAGSVADYAGPTQISGSLTLSNAPLSRTPSVTVSGSLIFSVKGAVDRLPDNVPLNLRGGSVQVTGGAGSETIGPVFLERGRSSFVANTQSATLTLASLGRLANHPVVSFLGQNNPGTLGGTNTTDPRIMISTAPQLTNNIIGGWALWEQFAYPMPSYPLPVPDFATYDLTLGVRALGAAGRPADFASAGEADNVLITSASQTFTLAGDTAVNSINFNRKDAAHVLDLAGKRLRVASGGVLAYKGQNDPATRITNGTLTAGTSSNSAALYLHNFSNVEANITNNEMGGAVSVVIAGPLVPTTFSGTNTYSGATHVLGTLNISSPTAVPLDNELHVMGTYKLPSWGTYRYATINLLSGKIDGSSTAPTVQFASLVLESGAISRVILSSAGPILKTGPGAATLSGSNSSYTGSVTINDGDLTLTGNGPVGAAPIVVNGGRLLPTAYTFSNTVTVNGGALAPTLNAHAHFKGTVNLNGDCILSTSDALDPYADGQTDNNRLSIENRLNIAAGVRVQQIGFGRLSISGTVTAGTGSSLALSGGTLIASVDLGGAPAPAAPALSLSAENNTVISFTAPQRLARLSLADDATASLDASNTTGRTLLVNALDMGESATLNLSDGALVVDYDAASPLDQIRQKIAAARNDGTWNRPGITSSAASSSAGSLALGIAEARDALGLSGAAEAVWRGMTVNATSLLVGLTVPGDADLSGSVNFFDLTALASHYGASGGWAQGDFNYDGAINFFDLTALASNYGTALPSAALPGATPQFTTDLAAAFASVPEPSGTCLLIAAATPALLKRRQRRRRSHPFDI